MPTPALGGLTYLGAKYIQGDTFLDVLTKFSPESTGRLP